MKSKLALTLVLSLFLSVSLPNITAYASTGSVMPTDVSQVSMDGITGMNYADSVGYYLEKEIPQGLEFIILGEDLLGKEWDFPIPYESTYHTPATPISKQISNYTVTGLWWGGIISDIFIAGGVGSATIAKTNNTQSQASVKPGLTAGWERSEWKDFNQKAQILRSVGITGNKAAWDLRIK